LWVAVPSWGLTRTRRGEPEPMSFEAAAREARAAGQVPAEVQSMKSKNYKLPELIGVANRKVADWSERKKPCEQHGTTYLTLRPSKYSSMGFWGCEKCHPSRYGVVVRKART